jgi:transposase
MAYRELFVVEIREILRLWLRGRSQRETARLTGADRKTVRRYVEAARDAGLTRDASDDAIDDALLAAVCCAVQPGSPTPPGAMREHCRAHRDLLAAWAAEGCKGPKLVRLLARQTGVTVPLRTLQRFVAEELGRGRAHQRTVRVPDPPPGREVEVDFCKLGDVRDRVTGESRAMWALLVLARRSRHQFVWPTWGQTLEDVVEGLEAAWRFFGGVFPVVISDNLKPVIDRADPLQPKINERLLEYAQARGFVLDAARVRRPKDKARVERQVQYVRNDWFAGEGLWRLEAARPSAARWCSEIAGLRTHHTTRRQPLRAFEEEEQDLLLAFPDEPWDQPVWSNHTVRRDRALSIGNALYSVPWTMAVGTRLRARRDGDTVKIYRRRQLVKVHPRLKEGGGRIDPADLQPGVGEMATRDGDALCRQAEAFGPNIGAYARALLDNPLPWTQMRHLYRLLGLTKRFGPDATDAACARSLDLGVVQVHRINRMLEKGLQQQGLLDAPQSRTAPHLPQKARPRFAREPSAFSVRSAEDTDAPT